MIIELFFVAFFLNLLYELLHSLLYKTCIEASLKKYVDLMLKAAFFDGAIIVILYVISFSIFSSRYSLLLFLLLSLIFAYIWEVYSLKAGKWEYAKSMPMLFGVGLTPFLQLAITGTISLCIVFIFLVQ